MFNTVVELIGGFVLIELVMRSVGIRSSASGASSAARLMQLRNQLQPNGDMVAAVVTLDALQSVT